MVHRRDVLGWDCTETAMAEAARRRMTPEEFFRWQEGQDEPFELVDGVPIPKHRMMTGASVQHDRVTVNVIIALGNQLRGSRCRRACPRS